MSLPETGPVPPHDLESEKWLLGAALTDETRATASKLDSRLFDDELHACCARVLRTIADEGTFPDIIAAPPRLQLERQFKGVNIPLFLGECVTGCVSVGNVPSLIDRLNKLADSRIVLSACRQASREAVKDPSRAFQGLSGAVDEIRIRNAQADPGSIYFDAARAGAYWVENRHGGWLPLNETQVKRLLKTQGISPNRPDGCFVSPLDTRLIEIQQTMDVHYAGPLAGHHVGVALAGDKRILITESPKQIEARPGDWPILHKLIVGLLVSGDCDQRPFFYGWLKVALETLRDRKLRPGQALALCGPHDCGKSLLQNLITILLGGRSAKPYQFMSGQTTFNADLFESEHLQIEDEHCSTDIRTRRAFGAAIKSFTVNESQRLHDKNRRAVNGLRPFWRVTITVNDEPESLMVLPPLDDSLEDKIILLRAFKKSMPMRTNSNEERAAFWETLVSELHAFTHFLMEWEIPDDIKSDRFGVGHYHHPDLLDALHSLSLEEKLLSLIDGNLFRAPSPGLWRGTASELEQVLTSSDSRCAVEARKLFHWPTACGTFLGRLERRHPNRIEFDRTATARQWTIRPLFEP